MRFDPPKSISNVLQDYLDKFPRKKQLQQGMVLSSWKEVVGERIASQAEDLHFEGSKLVMRVKNPSWRHEIHSNRYNIAKRLNSKVGGNVISELIVRG